MRVLLVKRLRRDRSDNSDRGIRMTHGLRGQRVQTAMVGMADSWQNGRFMAKSVMADFRHSLV